MKKIKVMAIFEIRIICESRNKPPSYLPFFSFLLSFFLSFFLSIPSFHSLLSFFFLSGFLGLIEVILI